MLVKVLEKAQSSPPRLAGFALAQVKKAVIEGDGPLAHGGTLTPGKVGRAEAELMRRILYAFGGDGNIAVTRAEAEVLFDINDATAEADNDPAWSELFVKAIANFMMAASGYDVPSRQEALHREEWLDEPPAASAASSAASPRAACGASSTPIASRASRRTGRSATPRGGGDRRRRDRDRAKRPSGSPVGSAATACCRKREGAAPLHPRRGALDPSFAAVADRQGRLRAKLPDTALTGACDST